MQQGLMDIVIEYCATRNHTPIAVSLTDDILKEREIEAFVKSWHLIPSTGGVFDVWVNGELIFSKKQVNRHAEPGEIRAGIMKVLDMLRPADVALARD